MAISRMSLLVLVHRFGVRGNVGFRREVLKVLAQAVMELEVSQKTGAERHKRSRGRITYRKGYRSRDWETRVDTLELQIPKLRQGSCPHDRRGERVWADYANSGVLPSFGG